MRFSRTFIVLQIKHHFHMKGCAPELVLKQGEKATRKWFIVVSARNCLACSLNYIVMQMRKTKRKKVYCLTQDNEHVTP